MHSFINLKRDRNEIETEIALEGHISSEIVSFTGSNAAIDAPDQFSTKNINLGILQKVLNFCLEESHATILTILLVILFSCGDSGTDLGMALSFFQASFYTEAYLILATDYFPVFLTLTHFFRSSMRSSMTFRQQAI